MCCIFVFDCDFRWKFAVGSTISKMQRRPCGIECASSTSTDCSMDALRDASSTSTGCSMDALRDRGKMVLVLLYRQVRYWDPARSQPPLCRDLLQFRSRLRLCKRGSGVCALPRGLLSAPGAHVLSAVAAKGGASVHLVRLGGTCDAETRFFECPYCAQCTGPPGHGAALPEGSRVRIVEKGHHMRGQLGVIARRYADGSHRLTVRMDHGRFADVRHEECLALQPTRLCHHFVGFFQGILPKPPRKLAAMCTGASSREERVAVCSAMRQCSDATRVARDDAFDRPPALGHCTDDDVAKTPSISAMSDTDWAEAPVAMATSAEDWSNEDNDDAENWGDELAEGEEERALDELAEVVDMLAYLQGAEI